MNGRRRTLLPDTPASNSPAGIDLDRRRLAEALDVVGDAIVVVDAGGEVVLRNNAADRFHDARPKTSVRRRFQAATLHMLIVRAVSWVRDGIF